MPRIELNESMNDSVYGSYGCARPFCALLARIRPPGTVRPDVAPWPAMPLLATEPLRLMMKRREVDSR